MHRLFSQVFFFLKFKEIIFNPFNLWLKIKTMETHYREEETYKIIGICMEVHRNLGPGLLEVIYKDAL